ncbi:MULTISPECIES: pyrimidine 5'-nucleotidase [unclassified Paracoccus (in: a-proteobacteria)]|uniref:pyrimidine 5'-nucleotidase n=1 Tax=unclassified Paracoccus (in: a-proteobacteria) TaxID=2688777 RepID=UPI0012B26844|nr:MULTISPECIES: pyrimidine 5'-nucleotidase [unclassified Paracoccus (in: a-proteobacteria)]UXU74068.1 pyrimidine 5'-nucleotidase [Paracoccus sp. SMMA_5]UXU79958.1 pyrimidine 5'-nucleotidase [Paracoccus sp. SMMA_5_TC]
MDFSRVTTWIFDLDNTLYPPEVRLFAQIEQRMTDYVMRELGVSADEARHLRQHYWRQHGTTLSGLMQEHGVDPMPYLRDVHDIDFSALTPDPELAALIAALPGRKIIHTNGDCAYAAQVLRHRGLMVFDSIHGIDSLGFHPKPDPRAYAAVLAAEGFDPATAAMFEDDPRNLVEPYRLGMTTILVGAGRHGPDVLAQDHAHGPHVHHRTADLTAFLRDLAGNARGATI